MDIKTVDLTNPSYDQMAKDITESLKKTGFLVVTNHGIRADLFSEFYELWDGFFKHPTFKQRFTFDRKTQFGYFPIKSEKAKGATLADIKEFYHYFGNNKSQSLPTLPVRLDQVTREAFTELEELSKVLLQIIYVNTPKEVIKSDTPWDEAVEGSLQTLLRILHYPPLKPEDFTEGAVRAAAHEDINFITLLPAATRPGLEVMDVDGNWHDVKILEKNSIIVNVGDMLQEATGGHYRSTTHRVVNPAGAENESRLSVPLFLHPRPSVRLSDRHTADSYLKERLRELGLI